MKRHWKKITIITAVILIPSIVYFSVSKKVYAATAFVQSATGAWVSGTTFPTGSITTTTGNLVACSVQFAAGNSTNNVSGVADSANGAYTLIDRQSSVVLGALIETTTWYAKNITGASGAVTATAGTSNIDHARINCEEISGADTTAPLGVHTSQPLTNPGTGADAISSGAVTATAGDYVFGATVDSNFADTYVVGTGFTMSQNGTGYATEHIANFAGGSKAATFTATFGTITYQTAVAMFEAAAGGATVVAPPVMDDGWWLMMN